MQSINPWRILGVSREVSPEELRRVYKRLVKEHHPDRGGDNLRFRQIVTAYQMVKRQDDSQGPAKPHQVRVVYCARPSYGVLYRQWRRLLRPRLSWHRGRQHVALPLLVAALVPAIGLRAFPVLTLACGAVILCTGKLRIIKY